VHKGRRQCIDVMPYVHRMVRVPHRAAPATLTNTLPANAVKKIFGIAQIKHDKAIFKHICQFGSILKVDF
jgi:hypothetical protein